MAYLEIIEGIDVGKIFAVTGSMIFGRGTESDICWV